MNDNPAMLRQEAISIFRVWKTMLCWPYHRDVFIGEEKTGPLRKGRPLSRLYC